MGQWRKIMRIAAIDFGLKRIGIALSDDRKKLALPFATVDGGKKGVANTVAALAKKQGEIERILVGLPLLMSGQKSEMAKEVEAFAKALELATGIPVELCDERLSSKMADQGMRELSMNRKERAERIDMAAAALLLQSYLDKNQS
jgi:putative Holliday junction resolvase